MSNPETNNEKNKFSSIWIWMTAIAIIFLILGIAVCLFFNRYFILLTDKTTEKQAEKSRGKLSYLNSIKDSEELALSGAHEFEIYNNYLYVTSVRDSGLEIMDISDSAKPKHIGAFFDNENTLMKKPHSVSFRENYAFLGSMGDSAIQVLDISNPKNITPISFLELGLKGLHGTAINGNYLYAAFTSDNAIEIIDISNPMNLKIITTLFDDETMSLASPHEFLFMDNYAFVLSGTEGLEILDISDPENPKHVSSLAENTKTALNGGHGMVIAGNYAYIAGYVDGFAIVDIADPKNPKQTGAIYPTEENGLLSAADIDLAGNYAFVVSEVGNSLTMIDISNSENPQIINSIKDDGSGDMFLWNGHFIKANGKYLYIAGLQDGFGVAEYK
jgi:hypothetical protein